MSFFRNKILKPLSDVKHYILGGIMILTLFVFVTLAKKSSNEFTCNGVSIRFHPAEKSKFLTETEVMDMLTREAGTPLTGSRFSDLNLHDLEQSLDKNDFVQNADIFTRMNDTLYVDIYYRNPVLRIISITHDDYYIDENGNAMPLSPNHTAKILIATGYISGYNDSTTEMDLYKMAICINKDSFLKALIGQIQVNQDKDMTKEFILVPRAGNLLIEFGDNENMEAKFEKLKIFYRKIYPFLEKDKYRSINLNYDSQIILKLIINEN
jgi:cell division protein FtsQ